MHGAPPCGTASRAREIKVPEHLRLRGAPAPVPLRSDRYPQGFPHLAGINKEKVTNANKNDEQMANCLGRCMDQGIGVSVENPKNSLMWKTPWCQELLAKPGMARVSFQNRMHGGRRPKLSTWATNVSELKVLGSACDESCRANS